MIRLQPTGNDQLPVAAAAVAGDDDGGWMVQLLRVGTTTAALAVTALAQPDELPRILVDEQAYQPPAPRLEAARPLAPWADEAIGAAAAPAIADDDPGYRPPPPDPYRVDTLTIWLTNDAATFVLPGDEDGYLPPRPWSPVSLTLPVAAGDEVVAQPEPPVPLIEDLGYLPPAALVPGAPLVPVWANDELSPVIGDDDRGYQPPIMAPSCMVLRLVLDAAELGTAPPVALEDNAWLPRIPDVVLLRGAAPWAWDDGNGGALSGIVLRALRGERVADLPVRYAVARVADIPMRYLVTREES